MPTGYTADLHDGKDVTFDQFVKQCARGMGALVTLRDAPWDAPLPERFEPSDPCTCASCESRDLTGATPRTSEGDAAADGRDLAVGRRCDEAGE